MFLMAPSTAVSFQCAKFREPVSSPLTLCTSAKSGARRVQPSSNFYETSANVTTVSRRALNSGSIKFNAETNVPIFSSSSSLASFNFQSTPVFRRREISFSAPIRLQQLSSANLLACRVPALSHGHLTCQNLHECEGFRSPVLLGPISARKRRQENELRTIEPRLRAENPANGGPRSPIAVTGALAAPTADSLTSGADDTTHEVVIVGGGVAGLATALALHRVGIPSVVLERSEELREGGSALSLWGNAWRALEVLGVAEDLRTNYTRLTSVKITSETGKTLKDFALPGGAKENGSPDILKEVRGVHRYALLKALAAPLPSGSVRFGAKPVSFREGTAAGTTEVLLKDGSRLNTRVLLGCDGVRSVVADYLGLGPANFSGYSAFRGIGKFPTSAGHELEPGLIQMVLGQGVRAGMYPLNHTDVYWFTCMNSEEGDGSGIRQEDYQDAALAPIRGWKSDIERMIKHTPSHAVSRSEITDRWTLPLPNVRWGRGGVTVLGDAAHPMTPNLGQGGCTSLEDAVVLAQELASCSTIQSSTGHKKLASSGDDNNDVGKALRASGSLSLEKVKQREVDNPRKASGSSIITLERTEEEDGAISRRRVLGDAKDIEEALARYDDKRIHRTTPLTVRANLMGRILQTPFAPVCFARNLAMPKIVNGPKFLDHAEFDCGELPGL
eukprot:TRINITY_DN546_c0_g1_i7.p1 TRINITY_DN546_c0_g1~~TRINITY_DN546_c0_g1_i7.p1  ORF type:complete len:674 (-),score=57.95 TRINITY_DN546_c0_g1_i7:150-2171(-)